MKELSIEEKAKAYDIALNKIKRLLGTGSNCSREELEYVFPELKESEGDRMRKEIISAIKEDWPGHTDWIVWLESQGETSPVLSNSSNIGKVEQKPWSEEDKENLDRIITIIHCYTGTVEEEIKLTNWLKSLKERVQPQPKQEWSEKDEKIINKLIAVVELYYGIGNDLDKQRCLSWLNSLKDR